jgi:hypothetical protein
VHTKLYDAGHERAVGDWHNKDLERVIREGRAQARAR